VPAFVGLLSEIPVLLIRSLTRPALLLCLSGLGPAASAIAADVQVSVTDGTGRPLADAVVFLDSPAAKAAVRPAQGIEIAQNKRQFVPRITVVPVGSAVQFPNHDTVRHHVYSFSATKKFELKLYAGVPAHPVVFDKPGVAVLGCNIHDQMSAWVVVVETPYTGQTGAAGTVTLANVPAGNHRLRIWHAQLPVDAPPHDEALAVAADGTSVTVRMTGLAP
jgi:plastocyanin